MLLILRDDRVLETFDSHEHPPDWAEWVDVVNNEYRFCDDRGQRYRGVLLQRGGLFRREMIGLEPVGQPDVANALSLLDAAVAVDPKRCQFSDVPSVRRHLTTACS